MGAFEVLLIGPSHRRDAGAYGYPGYPGSVGCDGIRVVIRLSSGKETMAASRLFPRWFLFPLSIARPP